MVTVSAYAQQPKAIDSLDKQISLYGIKNKSSVLFIHFDKTVYSTSEAAWFTAYLLNIADNKPYHTLSVALIDNDYKTVIQDDKFIMNNGRSFGTLAIPDSVSPGHYTFIAVMTLPMAKQRSMWLSRKKNIPLLYLA